MIKDQQADLRQVRLDRKINRITLVQEATTRLINTHLREAREKKGPEYEYWTRRGEVNEASVAVRAIALL